MLKIASVRYYKVKEGQTLREVAENFSVSEFLLARENRLAQPIAAGQILRIPDERGNAYYVRAGDTKALICGSEENYEKKNGTSVFYIGMRVIV